MTVQPLIATMFQKDFRFLDLMRVGKAFVAVNQTDFKNYPCLNLNETGSVLISNEDRGLSRSRYLALANSIADICVLADDDIIYVENFREKINQAYSELSMADVIIFDYTTNCPDRKSRFISKGVKKLNKLDLLNVSSVRISFNRQSVISKNIRFNELFGAGSVFPSGEDNLFLKDCYEKGLKIYYYPLVICSVDFGDSSWFTGFNKEYFISKGAFSYAYFGRFCHLYNLYFCVSKRKLYKNNLSFFSALKAFYIGKKQYKKLINEIRQ